MKKVYFHTSLFLLIFTSFISQTLAQVTYRDTTLLWQHFDYTLDAYNGMDSYSTVSIVEDAYPGLVLENEYVRLVILPEFGARILSFYYKPTKHEQFYLNPVGTPYGMGAGNFYYDWLMVMGGVFPTFPEPEHGKTWFLPWQWEITENSSERITLEMQLQDTINYPSHPGKFNNGITEVRCITTVSLQRGKTSFELTHSIQNTKSATIPFEYWTCTTLAPGSETGNTFTPATAEIIAPLDYVYLKDDWWTWMGNAEKPAAGQGNHVFEYKNLAFYENWADMGIAYAYPFMEANYYGVINHENGEGVFRVADNAQITTGMKFWTWGAEQGLEADPENFYHQARPYIELWSGLSHQFFEDAYLSPDETITWTETYLPTVAMDSVTFVNENGAIFLDHKKDEVERFITKIFSTTPADQYDLSVSLNGLSVINLYDGPYISDALNAGQYSFKVHDYIIDDGDYMLTAKVYNPEGGLLIEASLPVTVPFSPDGIADFSITKPKVLRLSKYACNIEFEEAAQRKIALFTLNGQLIQEQMVVDRTASIRVNKSGLYIIRIAEGDRVYSVKIVF